MTLSFVIHFPSASAVGMRSVLKEDRAARQFMANDPAAALRERGVEATAYAAESIR